MVVLRCGLTAAGVMQPVDQGRWSTMGLWACPPHGQRRWQAMVGPSLPAGPCWRGLPLMAHSHQQEAQGPGAQREGAAVEKAGVALAAGGAREGDRVDL